MVVVVVVRFEKEGKRQKTGGGGGEKKNQGEETQCLEVHIQHDDCRGEKTDVGTKNSRDKRRFSGFGKRKEGDTGALQRER